MSKIQNHEDPELVKAAIALQVAAEDDDESDEAMDAAEAFNFLCREKGVDANKTYNWVLYGV